jgi:predicted N-acetyltransferase YhbS
MPLDATIRRECHDDYLSIGNVISAAFSGKPYADGDEAELVEALRRENALSVLLVAELEGTVIGQVAFSPAQASDGTRGWYALGPVAVLPAHQRTGIGSKLVHAGLQAITELGANGCILVGDPAYYTRFGFRLSPSNTPGGESTEFFMVKLLGHQQPTGPIYFHRAFNSAA